MRELARALKGDGCTSVPDLTYRRCCDEHDVHYRTGRDVDGKPITRSASDTHLFQCMRKAGKTPIIGRFAVPVIYWFGVRLFGRRAYHRADG